MAVKHTGQVQPQLDLEEHYGTLDAKRVVLINKDDGAPYNADLSAEVDSISLASITDGVTLGLSTGANWIGLASVSGKVGLNAGSNYIGLATVNIGTTKAWSDPGTYIGLASVNVSGTVTVDATGQGDVPITLDSEEVALSAGANYIGLASVNISPIPAGTNYIGLASISGSVKNAGTTKTFVNIPITISASGSATIAVPTNKFHVTHLLLGSNATVTVNIKSGATYLVGNASVGIPLVPGGGWVENGSPESPIYEGLVSAAGLVIDTSATANVGGKVLYFDE